MSHNTDFVPALFLTTKKKKSIFLKKKKAEMFIHTICKHSNIMRDIKLKTPGTLE